MHASRTDVKEIARERAGEEHQLGLGRAAQAPAEPTDTGCSSSRPTTPSRPNMCCSAIISASPSIRSLEAKIANYLRRRQGTHGGWSLVQDGPFDMSASVKAYFALKMIGDSVDSPHMVRAREAIRSRGGASHSNVFTRFTLAMYGV